MYSASGNYEDFVYARCNTSLTDDLGDRIEEWLANAEPAAGCASCGWIGLLGDWPSRFRSAVVGGPAITLYRWPTFRPEFIADLAARLGGRVRSLWAHF